MEEDVRVDVEGPPATQPRPVDRAVTEEGGGEALYRVSANSQLPIRNLERKLWNTS